MVSAGEKRWERCEGRCRDLLAEQVEEVWNWTTCETRPESETCWRTACDTL